MSEVRGFTIKNPNGHPADSRVSIDGFDVTERTTAIRWEHRVGYVPVLELDLVTVDVTEITGRASVRVLFNGEEFDWRDVDAARSAGLPSLADRLAQVLPPRAKP